MYDNPPARTGAPTARSLGNYFEATVTVPGQPDPVTRGIEFAASTSDPTRHAFLIYSYDTNGDLIVNANHSPNPVVLCFSSIKSQGNDSVFSFINHVPCLRFTLMLPSGIPQVAISSSNAENFDVTAYAKPYYMQ
jgi:hypothetical protein